MCLESAQLLSAAHHLWNSSVKDECYRLTHARHPCTIWTAECSANYNWLFSLFDALNREFVHRFGQYKISPNHGCWRLEHVLRHAPSAMPVSETITPFAQAMPEELRSNDAVESYRSYYKRDKAHLLQYTNRDKPTWLT